LDPDSIFVPENQVPELGDSLSPGNGLWAGPVLIEPETELVVSPEPGTVGVDTSPGDSHPEHGYGSLSNENGNLTIDVAVPGRPNLNPPASVPSGNFETDATSSGLLANPGVNFPEPDYVVDQALLQQESLGAELDQLSLAKQEYKDRLAIAEKEFAYAELRYQTAETDLDRAIAQKLIVKANHNLVTVQNNLAATTAQYDQLWSQIALNNAQGSNDE